ncbi:hypothetical protein UMZ34_06100 [Halopseudomonas pachastrellae]|nr:hypothetical protein UMZ34_06100 [Halopseudomonas pachastrellae]
MLAVLQREHSAPQDLRERALFLAAHLFSLAYQERYEQGLERAIAILDEGKAGSSSSAFWPRRVG